MDHLPQSNFGRVFVWWLYVNGMSRAVPAVIYTILRASICLCFVGGIIACSRAGDSIMADRGFGAGTRCLLDSRLPRIKAQKGTSVYDETLAVARQALATPNDRNNWSRLNSCALMYACGEGDRYGRFAKDNLLKFIRDTPRKQAWNNDDHYMYRSLGVLPLTLAWTRALWTPAEIQECRDYFVPIAKAPWPGNFWASKSPANNYWGGYLLTEAIVGDVFNDQPLLNESQAKMLDFIRYANGAGKGGGFYESINYCGASIVRIVVVALILRETGNLDAFRKTDWFRESALFRIHTATPWGSNILLGDQPQSSQGDWREGDYLWPVSLADALPDGKERRFLGHWLRKWKDRLRLYGEENQWLLLLLNDPTVRPLDFKDLPFTWECPHPGIHIRRSSWSDDAVYAFSECGGLYHGHQMAAAGNFGFGRNGWLLKPGANFWGHSGELTGTGFCNVPIIGGAGQGATSDYTYPVTRIVRSTDRRVEMQGRDPYNATRQVCRDFTRVIEWLSDRLVVVWDRIVPFDSNAEISEQWHAKSVSSGTNNAFQLDRLRCTLLCTALFSSKVDNVNQGAGGTKSSERLVIKTKARSIIFVFQMEQPDGAYTPLSVKQNSNGTATINGITVLPPGPTVPNPLTN